MAPSATGPTASKAGIITGRDGERHIPSSVRPDGTVRKEIRVRPGYRPPEDVEKYKNKTAEAWKNKGNGGVPGAAVVDDKDTASSGAANKNAKRREARKRAAATKEGDEAIDGDVKNETVNSGTATQESAQVEPVDPEAEKAKEARKLAKKLRQARELKEKKDKSEVLLPEQFAKVLQINELVRQLDKLGFDSEGNPSG